MTAISTDEALAVITDAAERANSYGWLTVRDELLDARAHLRSLRARCEALQADAARYRWLRLHRLDLIARNTMNDAQLHLPSAVMWDCDNAVDAFIDSRMGAARTTTEEGK